MRINRVLKSWIRRWLKLFQKAKRPQPTPVLKNRRARRQEQQQKRRYLKKHLRVYNRADNKTVMTVSRKLVPKVPAWILKVKERQLAKKGVLLRVSRELERPATTAKQIKRR